MHTGQNYDYNLNQVFFEDLGLRAPDFYLDAVGKDLGETIGNIIAKSYALMVEQKPDALLILGDTNSCLSAISAKRLHIPIFHMEAGNRCFDECLPEETNRRIVDHIADVNMCYSEHARRYLNAGGHRQGAHLRHRQPHGPRCSTPIWKRSRPPMCWNAWAWPTPEVHAAFGPPGGKHRY